MATAAEIERQDEEVQLHSLHPNPPNGYQRRYTVYLQIKYLIDANDEYQFEYQFERRIPDEHAGFFVQTVERSNWTSLILPGGVMDIPIKDGDTFVVIETMPSPGFPDIYWSIENEGIMTRENRQILYGDLKYGDGTTWQELADYRQSHPGPSTCRWISFKAKLDPNPHPDVNSPNRKHKFSYFFYLRDPQGAMKELEVDPDIKNPSA